MLHYLKNFSFSCCPTRLDWTATFPACFLLLGLTFIGLKTSSLYVLLLLQLNFFPPNLQHEGLCWRMVFSILCHSTEWILKDTKLAVRSCSWFGWLVFSVRQHHTGSGIFSIWLEFFPSFHHKVSCISDSMKRGTRKNSVFQNRSCYSGKHYIMMYLLGDTSLILTNWRTFRHEKPKNRLFNFPQLGNCKGCFLFYFLFFTLIFSSHRQRNV